MTDFTGFPVVYEKPFMVAYRNFLGALAHHYNPYTGSPNGRQIAPYIAYVRAGMAEGGENQPFCSAHGIPNYSSDNTWSSGRTVPLGFIVNINNTEYVATGAGKTGTTTPTCSTPGCTTAPDNSVPGWYNAGPWTENVADFAIWPGPATWFGSSEKNGFFDNGYLSKWPNSTDGTGYITSMLSFLEGLGATFPWDINAHNGLPVNIAQLHGNVAYADSEAMMASASGIGFGMDAVSVMDSQTYANNLLTGNFPSSATDWAHNFKVYPAPVHHLQTYQPGQMYFAAGYLVSSSGITIAMMSGQYVATVNCASDCSSFQGAPIYISDNANPFLNGIWWTCPSADVTFTCTATSTQLQFKSPVSSPATNYGGIIWAPDYWPIVMPFAVQHGTTSIEVYECDLDYAFGAYPTFETTTWVGGTSGQGGCLEPPASPPYSPLMGSYLGYKNTLLDTMLGIPQYTGAQVGANTLAGAASKF